MLTGLWSIMSRSTLTSLSYRGLVTCHRTVKWSILSGGPLYFEAGVALGGVWRGSYRKKFLRVESAGNNTTQNELRKGNVTKIEKSSTST